MEKNHHDRSPRHRKRRIVNFPKSGDGYRTFLYSSPHADRPPVRIAFSHRVRRGVAPGDPRVRRPPGSRPGRGERRRERAGPHRRVHEAARRDEPAGRREAGRDRPARPRDRDARTPALRGEAAHRARRVGDGRHGVPARADPGARGPRARPGGPGRPDHGTRPRAARTRSRRPGAGARRSRRGDPASASTTRRYPRATAGRRSPRRCGRCLSSSATGTSARCSR